MPEAVSANYSNSRQFDVHRWSEHPQIRDLTNELYGELRHEIPLHANHEDHKIHLRVLLLDLYHRYLEDPDGWIGLSLNRNDYSGPRRYNKLFLAYRPMHRIFDLLRDHQYIRWAPGFHDRSRRIGYQTRIRSGDRLMAIFAALNEHIGCLPFNERLPEQYSEELVILRDEQRNDIDYPETEQTRLMRARLTAYNDFLRGSHIDVSLRGWQRPECIDLTRKKLRRIFNNSSWEQGGRFYGGWWQNCSRDLRQRIVISNKKTVEIDYSALHIVLLYAKKGLDYWTAVDEDPYLNEWIFRGALDRDQHRRLRDTVKTLSLASINASDQTQAIRGVRQEIDPQILDEIGISLAELLASFVRFHSRISEYLYSGVGVHLQFVDSQITEYILDRMILRERVEVLPVHDSYVCCIRDDNLLREAVNDGIDEVLAARGWASVSVRTKEKMGQLYEHPRTGDVGIFVDTDIRAIHERTDHDLMARQQLWWQTGQQAIVNIPGL